MLNWQPTSRQHKLVTITSERPMFGAYINDRKQT